MNVDFFKNISPETWATARNVLLTIVIGYIMVQLLAFIIRRLFWKNMSKQSKMLMNKGIVYSGVFIIGFLVFTELGIKITTLLGAAGVLGIVVGIASQTSIGNAISGLFLISERSFEIGDLIRVGDKLGHVYSIDLLSIKLKTLDNLLIRIPNLTIISTEVTNITRFPIRRMEINLSVAYKEDLGKVMNILKKICAEEPLCLDEPEPLILFQNFGDSGIEILLGVWFEKPNFVKTKNSIFQTIKKTFDEEGIEIPFPHTTIYTGDVTKPFPVKVEYAGKEK
ncbi:MAG: mechanosensitive ion channel family protein [Bacteroidales bacterium]|nr:mechanosensitive ion channel family protein [Bacteroidales bacterium]